MRTQAGVWIDHNQAIVILLTDNDKEIRKFKTAVEEPARSGGSSRSKNKYTPNDFIAEDRRERKLMVARKKVYEEILAWIRDADSLLILGPGEAKGEFRKYLLAKRHRRFDVEIETTDKMTDRQLVAKVREHFLAATAGKTHVTNKPRSKSAKRLATTGK